MELGTYLLPLVLIYPIAINSLAKLSPSLRSHAGVFLAPAILLGLTSYSFFIQQPVQWILWPTVSFNIGLRLDVLSGLIAATVLTIGLVVLRYSVRFLEDDPKQDAFMTSLSCTLSCVLAMLMASNMVVFFVAWMGTSFFLHQLLIHFSERTGAVKAAEQKFWVSRLGDVFILSSGVLLFYVFNSLEFEVLFQKIEDPQFLQKNQTLINTASFLLVLGAMTKSAQFPFHFWLPNTMETPTPVSALMHAGIINAGGYLMVRMSPFLAKTPLSLSFLALVGGFTAFWGFVVMLTQTNVKRSLAYSTISQMGFMMLQCGLGAFSVAVIHIIGHAFYKAYAFLSSGTATDFGRLQRYSPKQQPQQNVWTPYVVALCSITVIFGALKHFGYQIFETPGTSVLLMILSLAVAQIVLSSKNKIRSISAALAVVVVYVLMSKVMTSVLAGIAAPSISSEGAVRSFTLILCMAFFVVLYLLQNNLEKISRTEFGKRLYVKTLRGTNP